MSTLHKNNLTIHQTFGEGNIYDRKKPTSFCDSFNVPANGNVKFPSIGAENDPFTSRHLANGNASNGTDINEFKSIH